MGIGRAYTFTAVSDSHYHYSLTDIVVGDWVVGSEGRTEIMPAGGRLEKVFLVVCILVSLTGVSHQKLDEKYLNAIEASKGELFIIINYF